MYNVKGDLLVKRDLVVNNRSSSLLAVNIPNWQTAKAYLIGDTVYSSNILYKALTNHISGTFAADLAANQWIMVTSGGSGVSNLALGTITSTVIPITNSNGTGFTIPASTSSLAGLESAVNNVKLGFLTLTGAVNLDTVNTNVSALVTLSGVSAAATNLGTFTGTTIADNVTVKPALQSLETAVETKQATLVSGTNIKTVNGTSLLGSGDITISGGGTSKYAVTVASSAAATCRVKGSASIVVTKTSGSIYTFAIPASGYLENADLFIPASEAPGSNLSLVFNYTSNTITNQGLSTADAPTCKGFFTSGGVPVDVYYGSSTASAAVLRQQITAVGSGNITVVLDLGTAGLASGDIVIKVNF